ncbi:hypothetical protein FGB62_169g41 [Gracilaria domingensis]|nr:hypothetical protein FGB62_169g41 [Gracilaria domingensis]
MAVGTVHWHNGVGLRAVNALLGEEAGVDYIGRGHTLELEEGCGQLGNCGGSGGGSEGGHGRHEERGGAGHIGGKGLVELGRGGAGGWKWKKHAVASAPAWTGDQGGGALQPQTERQRWRHAVRCQRCGLLFGSTTQNPAILG